MTAKYILPLFLLLSSCTGVIQNPFKDKEVKIVEPQVKEIAATTALVKNQKEIDVELKLKNYKLFKKAITKKNPNRTKKMNKFCKKVDKAFFRYGWGKSRCSYFPWSHVRNSVKGDPLMWVTYGNENQHKKKHQDATLIMCGVHGDEITPVKFCYDVLLYLEKVRLGVEPESEWMKDRIIVVAPIVNPDSFFKKRPTRTNARGVDINRNFPTRDWSKDALRMWKHRYGRQKRRYPGKSAMSEPEVLFQVNLIKRYKFDKIVSVHAPLTLIDYDGPTHQHSKGNGESANELLITMSKKASGYKIKNYPFFPGSLGNWAGNERNIPTYTLELPTSDNRNHKKYWKRFRSAIVSAISHDMRDGVNVAVKSYDNPLKGEAVN